MEVGAGQKPGKLREAEAGQAPPLWRDRSPGARRLSLQEHASSAVSGAHPPQRDTASFWRLRTWQPLSTCTSLKSRRRELGKAGCVPKLFIATESSIEPENSVFKQKFNSVPLTQIFFPASCHSGCPEGFEDPTGAGFHLREKSPHPQATGS